ncbi:MAG TPA: hypothetical protein VGN52_22190 [Burkholderiales bacterium]|jgi:hypothetical protein
MRFEDGEDPDYYGWRHSYWVLAAVWAGATLLSGAYGRIASRHPHFCVAAALFSFGVVGLLAAMMGGRSAAAFMVDCLDSAVSLLGASRGVKSTDEDNYDPILNPGARNTGWGPFFRVLVAFVVAGIWALIVHLIAARW